MRPPFENPRHPLAGGRWRPVSASAGSSTAARLFRTRLVSGEPRPAVKGVPGDRRLRIEGGPHGDERRLGNAGELGRSRDLRLPDRQVDLAVPLRCVETKPLLTSARMPITCRGVSKGGSRSCRPTAGLPPNNPRATGSR